jgi:DNA-binding Lrp family transcriptional regulator
MARVQNDSPEFVTLDDTDRLLIAALRENSRIPNNRLAEIAGISPSTCLQRVRALVDTGVLRRFTVDVDADALGFGMQALVSVRIRPGARDRLDTFAEQLRELPQVAQYFYLAGAEDFVIHFRGRNTQDLRDFVTDHLSTQPIVASTNTSVIFDHEYGPLRG